MDSQSSPPPKRASSLSHGSTPTPTQNQSHKSRTRSTDPTPAPSGSNNNSNNDQNQNHNNRAQGSRTPLFHHALHHNHNNHNHDNIPNNDREETARHRRHLHRHLRIDTSVLDRARSKSPHGLSHRHSKSHDSHPHWQRSVNGGSISSAGAKALLLPIWPGREKHRDSVDGLLKPVAPDMDQSRWNSMSTGSRKGSLISESDLSARAGPFRKQEIRNMKELEQVKKRRKQGERFLKSSLGSVGTLATEITRRLDFTYYNLLERIGDLHSTIASFQELSMTTSALSDEFERESTGLCQEIRKQIEEHRGFDAQVQQICALEKRVRAGKEKVEALSGRLQSAGRAIDDWERRELELEKRSGRRFRVFWVVAAISFLVVVVAIVMRNW